MINENIIYGNPLRDEVAYSSNVQTHIDDVITC